MSISEHNMRYYGSAVMPENNTTENIGGAMATQVKVTFSSMSATGSIGVVCEAATSATLRYVGRDISGAKITGTITFNGTTPVFATAGVERVLKAWMATRPNSTSALFAKATIHSGTAQAGAFGSLKLAAAASTGDNAYQFMVLRLNGGTGANQFRDITKYNGTTKVAHFRPLTTAASSDTTYSVHEGMVFDHAPYHINTIRRIFYDAAAEAEDGAAVTMYEKIFVFNTHSTLCLTNALLSEVEEGLYERIDFALEATLNHNSTNGAGNTRLEIGDNSGRTFNSADKSMANSQNFTPLAQQGIWMRLDLPAGTAAANSFYKFRVRGQTT